MPLGLIFGACAMAAMLASRLVLWLKNTGVPLPACPFKKLSGFPCPTCGGTRALAALARGDWIEAVALNPAVAVTALSMMAWAAAAVGRAITRSRRPSLVLTRGGQRALRVGGAMALIGNWVYLVLRG